MNQSATMAGFDFESYFLMQNFMNRQMFAMIERISDPDAHRTLPIFMYGVCINNGDWR